MFFFKYLEESSKFTQKIANHRKFRGQWNRLVLCSSAAQFDNSDIQRISGYLLMLCCSIVMVCPSRFACQNREHLKFGWQFVRAGQIEVTMVMKFRCTFHVFSFYSSTYLHIFQSSVPFNSKYPRSKVIYFDFIKYLLTRKAGNLISRKTILLIEGGRISKE